MFNFCGQGNWIKQRSDSDHVKGLELRGTGWVEESLRLCRPSASVRTFGSNPENGCSLCVGLNQNESIDEHLLDVFGDGDTLFMCSLLDALVNLRA